VVIDTLAAHLLAPYRTTDILLTSATGLFTAFVDFSSAINWVYLLSSLIVAFILYLSSRARTAVSWRELLRFMFPSAIYTHRSALLDYRFVAVDLTIKALIYVPLVSLCGAAAFWLVFKLVYAVAGNLGHVAIVAAWPRATLVVTVVVAVLAVDFCMFLAHYLQHKLPLLWCFHQVHHSAEVLTPITVFRKHPIEDLVFAIIAPALSGLGTALYFAVSGQEVATPKVLGAGVGQVIAFMTAYHLRHSHLWLSYGPVLNRIFISPAQHQIHHSKDPRHWDRNYGFLFAFWDSLFGSLYVPRHRETFEIGLVGGAPADFSTVARLYSLPFAKALRLLRGRVEVTSRRARRARSDYSG
jgi:sterol desaturase/sphingolipid hydroxylase (fatty acid hydroxylase superfamily)